MKQVNYKGSIYKFIYREDVLKHYHWFMNDKGKWLCRIIRNDKRKETRS